MTDGQGDRSFAGDSGVAGDPGFGALRDRVVPSLGERAVDFFVFTLATAATNTEIADTYRERLEQSGNDLAHPEVTETEQLLIDWAALLAVDPGAIDGDMSARLDETFKPELRASLEEFAASLLGAE
jgi:hypothetical protein